MRRRRGGNRSANVGADDESARRDAIQSIQSVHTRFAGEQRRNDCRNDVLAGERNDYAWLDRNLADNGRHSQRDIRRGEADRR
jgi:hypothetical protein